jgi:hypothetical protein
MKPLQQPPAEDKADSAITFAARDHRLAPIFPVDDTPEPPRRRKRSLEHSWMVALLPVLVLFL